MKEQAQVSDHEYWMEQALKLAKQAAENNEVPVGAIVVLNGDIIGRGSNSPIHMCDPSAHAEILALRDAARQVGNYRLVNADLYVTLEPCAMCSGALVHSRIRHLYYGATEGKSGAVSSHLQLLDQPCMNHKVEVTSGILVEQCSGLLSAFFARRRAEKKRVRKILVVKGLKG